MTRPSRYTLVNPHDAYEFEAADDEIADAVCLLLGGGWYSWTRGKDAGALLGFETDEVKQQEIAEHLGTVIDERRREMVRALRSVEIDPEGRAAAQADPEVWHQEHRTSFSDCRESAQETATAMERS